MSQHRRSIISNQRRPKHDQPVQIGIKPARMQRRCSAANSRCGFRHSIPRRFESNIVHFSISPNPCFVGYPCKAGVSSFVASTLAGRFRALEGRSAYRSAYNLH